MGKIIRDIVVTTWYSRGLEAFFVAFNASSSALYEAFLYTMGVELMTKSYLLAMRADEFEGMELEERKACIDKMMRERKNGHQLRKMATAIQDDSEDEDFTSLMNSVFRTSGKTGMTFLRIMEAGFLECRYPVPESISRDFPVDGCPGAHWMPLHSTEIRDFSFPYARSILRLLNDQYGIKIPRERYKNIINDEAGERFTNIFLNSNSISYVGKKEDQEAKFKEIFSAGNTEGTE